ncbi:cupin domain-containing protein [Chitinophaga sp. sic0106]|uniref:cupin domain-containing protein n=1 Tax=Chitinophaga sp. sic0106 TaxID=2854785 RepID=UPI001C48EABD|nr:cupin domain-containing protein [Chitinophaga sp. sic0106]MBV7532328.1 cupin domain-containing protein [Chitinophaga sp. sic0106]
MKKIEYPLVLCFLCVLSGIVPGNAQGLPGNKFGDIYSESIKWLPFPAFPPEARLAVLVGEPQKIGPYVIRVRVPAGVILRPHIHPENRIYTVISGVFYIGIGAKFDASKLKAYPPGSVIVLPGNTPHFHWAQSGNYETQVTANGPLGISYVDPSDDPRNKRRHNKDVR